MSRSNDLIYGLVSIIFLLLGVIFLAGSQLHTLTCDRTHPPTDRGTCQLSHAGLWGKETHFFLVEELLGAEIDEHRDSDGDLSYQVMIWTQRGDLPLTNGFSDGYRRKQSQVDRVDRFVLNKSVETLTIRQDNRGSYLWAGLFILMGSAGLKEYLWERKYASSWSRRRS
jgi:hypothetical protein